LTFAFAVLRGIAPERISARGFDATRRVADSDTTAGRKLSRRVEIAVSE
jgi:flagellar motor protein MotB